MRELARIPRIIARVARYWVRNPDKPLMRIIGDDMYDRAGLSHRYPDTEACSEGMRGRVTVFHVEDAALERALDAADEAAAAAAAAASTDRGGHDGGGDGEGSGGAEGTGAGAGAAVSDGGGETAEARTTDEAATGVTTSPTAASDKAAGSDPPTEPLAQLSSSQRSALYRLEKLWQIQPDQRLGQFLENYVCGHFLGYQRGGPTLPEPAAGSEAALAELAELNGIGSSSDEGPKES